MAAEAGDALGKLLTAAKIRRLAGDRVQARGETLWRDGAVHAPARYGDRLVATVRGTRPYNVALWREDKRLASSCTCPYDDFCKHRVALALAFRHGDTETLDRDPMLDFPETTAPPAAARQGAIDLRAYLLAQPSERLAVWLLEQSIRDETLRERLRLTALAEQPDAVDVGAFRQRIDAAFDFPEPDYDDYRDDYDNLPDFAARVTPVIDALATLLAKGQDAAVFSLAAHALKTLNAACARLPMDNDDLASAWTLLGELHARAGRDAPPDGEMLADWLFRIGVEEAADSLPPLSWKNYRPLLGAVGEERFRERARTAWERLPALTPADRGSDFSRRRRELRRLMEAFAVDAGDVDARAAVAQKDLSTPTAFTEVAVVYRDAQRFDEALAWLEKGRATFADQPWGGEKLRDLLAEEYRRRGREADAMALYWDEFAQRPSLDRYKTLKREARRAWPAWREKAFAHIRARLSDARRSSHGDRDVAPRYASEWTRRADDHSLLVEILLWERKPEEAWEEARTGGCAEAWWLKLSAWREKKHPEDCVPIWQRRVERLTRNANTSDYPQAAEALEKLGKLLARTGKKAQFLEQMQTLRETLKRRPAFIRALNKRRLP